MQTAIISDLHANLPAVRAVLTDIRRSGVTDIVCLGDLVGYNGFPRETIAAMRESGAACVSGNHDLMAIGRLSEDGCGPIARRAIAWTRDALADEDRWYLEGLPAALRHPPDLLCVHSVLDDPIVRLTTPAQFSEQARRLQEQRPRLTLCFTGHTHRQHAVEVTPAGEVVTHTGETVSLGTAGEGGAAGPSYWFVNPGSVGDMATRDQRAAYAVVDRDAGEVRFHRVVYDRSAVLRENARHGLGPGPIGRAAAALLGGLLSGALSPSARP